VDGEIVHRQAHQRAAGVIPDDEAMGRCPIRLRSVIAGKVEVMDREMEVLRVLLEQHGDGGAGLRREDGASRAEAGDRDGLNGGPVAAPAVDAQRTQQRKGRTASEQQAISGAQSDLVQMLGSTLGAAPGGCWRAAIGGVIARGIDMEISGGQHREAHQEQQDRAHEGFPWSDAHVRLNEMR